MQPALPESSLIALFIRKLFYEEMKNENPHLITHLMVSNDILKTIFKCWSLLLWSTCRLWKRLSSR